MNNRDFCFWLQGYCEITENEMPNLTQLKMIAEHLTIAREDVHEGSMFCKFTDMLQGFFDINGLDDLSPEQWEKITTRLQELFTKVTSTLEELEDNQDIIREAIERMREEREKQPYTPPPPFIPPQPNPWEPLNPWQPHDPWRLPDVICNPGSGDRPEWLDRTVVTCSVQNSIKDAQDTIANLRPKCESKAFCASGNTAKFDDSLTKACMSLESAYDRVQMDDEKLG